MQFLYRRRLRDPKILEGIRALLEKCDGEFIPPLSSRGSTTQAQLLTNGPNNGIGDYFAEVSKQSAIVVTENKQVIAFASFKSNYVCEHISADFSPNLYVTTILVDPEHRNRSIASQIYKALFKRFPKHYIFLRTWSTNTAHIRILLSCGFHEHCVLNNDRGEGVDTNYYRYNPQKASLPQYIQQYRLGNNLFFGLLLLLITGVFLSLWIFSDSGIVHELALAIATSLMASLLCLISDTFLKIRESKNDKYINTLKSHGIANLQFNKNELLEVLLPHCRNEIWISGYRLVMTGKATFRQALVTACKRSRNLNIKLLVTPPWTEAYRLVYGSEDVSVNYLRVLKDLSECREAYGLALEVHFSQKPLFSDTYKVDNRFITGPYLHCADKYNDRITAKDFFSFDIASPDAELYELFQNDYMTLWNEAPTKLDIAKFAKKIRPLSDFSALTKEQRLQLMLDCCIPNAPESIEAQI